MRLPPLTAAPSTTTRYLPRHAAARRRVVTGTTAAAAALGLLAGGAVALHTTEAGAWPSSTVTITGHGYGHGRGMSQYGAYGYATMYGWTYQQILAHYYGGTTLGTAANTPIRVAISSLEGSSSLSVTSGSAFSAGGVPVPAGAAATLTPSGTRWTVAVRPRGCSTTAAKPVATASNLISPASSSPDAPAAALLSVCGNGIMVRGTLALAAGGHVVNTLPVESYLRGSVPHESPAGWGDAAGGKGMAALQSQAVAARTYALNQHRYGYADICDNQNCQMYTGAGQNGQLTEDPRSNRAIASTAGRVLRNAAGALVSAEYSSSSGGYTAGGAFPAVPDLGDVTSPNHNWTVQVSAAGLAAAFGLGSTLRGLTITGRTGLGADGGRVTGVRITGATGSTTVTGNDFASTLGLKSNWFSVAIPTMPTIVVSNSVIANSMVVPQHFGLNGDRPLVCDTTGTGKDAGAVFRNGMFYVRTSLADGVPVAASFPFGRAGDVPLCGDWNGDGRDTVGVYRPATHSFYLAAADQRNTPYTVLSFGVPGDLPVAGDWTGTGRDSIGVFRPSTGAFYLSLATTRAAGAVRQALGRAGDVPVAGDWTGAGRDSVGVYRNQTFLELTRLGSPTVTAVHFGRPGDLPLVGDWNGDGKDTVGVGRAFTQY